MVREAVAFLELLKISTGQPWRGGFQNVEGTPYAGIPLPIESVAVRTTDVNEVPRLVMRADGVNCAMNNTFAVHAHAHSTGTLDVPHRFSRRVIAQEPMKTSVEDLAVDVEPCSHHAPAANELSSQIRPDGSADSAGDVFCDFRAEHRHEEPRLLVM